MAGTPFISKATIENSHVAMGSLFSVLATGKETSGSYSLFEFHTQPGAEPPPHMHTREDETFYIMEGELTIQCGDEVIKAKAGDHAFLPRNVTHSFKVDSKSAKIMLLCCPAGIEDFFEKLGEPATSVSYTHLTLPTSSPV